MTIMTQCQRLQLSVNPRKYLHNKPEPCKDLLKRNRITSSLLIQIVFRFRLEA